MSFVTESAKYEPVGKGKGNEKYDSIKIKAWVGTDADVAGLVTDALEFTGGDFNALKNAVINGLNSYKRFKDQPGLTEEAKVEKVLALLAKLGLKAEDIKA